MKSQNKFLFCLCLFFLSISTEAKLVQILHTNDLHGLLEHTATDPTRGGYAAIKGLMDKYKLEAKNKGIETLALDAGDFMEGSLFYQANQGQDLLSIITKMGYDAISLGNHDWLMGTEELNALMGKLDEKTPLLAANVKANAILFPGLHARLKPFIIKKIAGVNVAIMGLTTDDIFYRWRFYETSIKDPVNVGRKLAEELRSKHKADFVIALTHLGLEVDKALAKKADVDFIVGGHSHTHLPKPFMAVNEDLGEKIGIAQTGEFGNYLGRYIVDLVPGKRLKIVKFELIPVMSGENRDPHIAHHIEEARSTLNQMYGKEWLNKKIGESEIPLINSDWHLTPWTAFVVDAFREARNAHVAFHAPSTAGVDLMPGPITNENLLNGFPRFFDLKDRDGWMLYDVRVNGAVLSLLIRLAVTNQLAMAMSGVTFDVVHAKNNKVIGNQEDIIVTDIEKPGIRQKVGSEYKIKNIKIWGQRLRCSRVYRTVMPEGLVRGALGITGAFNAILKEILKTEMSQAQAIRLKFKKWPVVKANYVSQRGHGARGGQVFLPKK